MSSIGSLDAYYAASLSIASHNLETLAEFPDARAFYESAPAALPAGIRAVLYTATCNRIEIYAEFSESLTVAEGQAHLAQMHVTFSRLFSCNPQIYQGGKALAHLIAVASGLKSLALGETQIAGQLKRDLAHASRIGWTSAGLTTFMNKALETQKQIRATTGISENAYSLMSLVDETIRERKLTPIKDRIILVGASEMSAKVVRFAARRSVREFILVRKDLARPMNAELEQLIKAAPEQFRQVSLAEFCTWRERIAADAMVLASTAPHPLFSAAQIQALTTNGVLANEAAIVDLSLPANVAADAIADLQERLVSLASLQAISENARAKRMASAREADPIIRRAVYQMWLDSLHRENPNIVNAYIEKKNQQSDGEWQRLANEAALSEKQKRIMYDFIKKEQRRALQQHREMILDLIAGSEAAPVL